MLGWLFIILLAYASVRWTAVGVVVRASLLVSACIGLAILTKVGFVPVFMEAIIRIPIDLVRAVFGLAYHILFG